MAETEKIQFHRPANNDEFKQTKAEKDMMSYVVLYGCSNVTAYGLFNRHLLDNSGKLNKAGQSECRMFFSHPNNIAYMEAMRAHLEALTKGTVKVVSNDTINDSRKDNALKNLLNQAMSLVERGEDLDADSLKTISEIFKKVGLLKDEVEVQESPRRYLPERCFSGCRYRLFVENAMKGGAVIDECQYCKALAYATENGYRDDATKRLDIPKEVLDAEPENTVKTLDILSGKVEN